MPLYLTQQGPCSDPNVCMCVTWTYIAISLVLSLPTYLSLTLQKTVYKGQGYISVH